MRLLAEDETRMVQALTELTPFAILFAANEGGEIPPEQRKQIFERFYRDYPILWKETL